MTRLLAFILISFLVHLIFVLVAPKFEISYKEKQKTIEVEIFEPAPRVMPKPTLSEVSAGNKSKTNVEKAQEKPKANVERSLQPTITMPKIEVPLVDVETSFTIEVPDLMVSEIATENSLKVDNKLLSEIVSTEESVAKEIGSGQSDQANVSSEEMADNSFFILNNISNNKRRITHLPARPTFALANDTKISLRFKIDRLGNTYGIVLITRTDSRIEQLAAEFVEKIKFNSAISSTSDSAEITLYFKVK